MRYIWLFALAIGLAACGDDDTRGTGSNDGSEQDASGEVGGDVEGDTPIDPNEDFDGTGDPDIIGEDTEPEVCLYCHSFRDDGTFVGLPTLEGCMECHDDPESPMGEDPEEEKFLVEYVANEKEIPWLVYSRQPDCVYFSHVAHVMMGEIECKTCHGDHGKSEELRVYKKNRLTGYSRDIYGKNIAGYKKNPWDGMKMDDCADCHTKSGVSENNACFVCHK